MGNVNIFEIFIYICAGLFALLHLIAALSQLKARPLAPQLLMAAGALGLGAAVYDSVNAGAYDWLLALLACGMICGAAIWNGRRSGELHLSHHITRIALALILVIDFVFV
ncbi:MAG: hypothetical protein K2P33_02800 [Acutalibacter sp.]|jgi:hypothetical protein|nr:hypothetical protein [Acutalibacter sp.]